MDAKKKLYRLPKQGQIAGVCAGLADYFDMDVSLMRVIWVVMAILSSGAMIIVYFILAIVIPTPDTNYTPHKDKDLNQKVQDLGSDLRQNKNVGQFRNIFGACLLFFGLWLLLVQFFPQWISFRWDFVWPIILILVGFLIIVKRK